VPQSYYFCIKNALKLTYDHLYFKKKKIPGSLSLGMKGRNTKRRKERGVEGRGGGEEWKGREGKGREGRGRKGKGRRRKEKRQRPRGYSPPNLELCPRP
jgi:hypothetical protein